jgi:predicted SprT family Zn-dependent metalloprotease
MPRREVHPELISAANAALEEAWNRFPMRTRPTLEWKSYRVTAGMAYFNHWSIGLSYTVLNSVADVRETVLHEYAHLLSVDRHGRKGAGHGRHWQKAMIDLGLEPKVRHQMPVERNVARQKVIYRCKKCNTKFEKRRRFPKGRLYIHLNCGGVLEYVETIAVTNTTETS